MAGTLDDLPDQLRASADMPGEQAAVAVLAAHGRWLRHPDFLLTCLRTFRDEYWIQWRLVRRFLARTRCSELDEEVLLLAVELATEHTRRRLDESTVLGGLDGAAYRRLRDAVDLVTDEGRATPPTEEVRLS